MAYRGGPGAVQGQSRGGPGGVQKWSRGGQGVVHERSSGGRLQWVSRGGPGAVNSRGCPGGVKGKHITIILAAGFYFTFFLQMSSKQLYPLFECEHTQ